MLNQSIFSSFMATPLGVYCAKRRHPEWTILSHVDCFIQGEVIGFQVLLLLDSVHPLVLGHFGGLLQLPKGESVTVYLASVSFSIHAVWLNREKCLLQEWPPVLFIHSFPHSLISLKSTMTKRIAVTIEICLVKYICIAHVFLFYVVMFM